jgi:hypothetical protein
MVVVFTVAKFRVPHDSLAGETGLLQRTLFGRVVHGGVALHSMHAVLAKEMIDKQPLSGRAMARASKLRQERNPDRGTRAPL